MYEFQNLQRAAERDDREWAQSNPKARPSQQQPPPKPDRRAPDPERRPDQSAPEKPFPRAPESGD